MGTHTAFNQCGATITCIKFEFQQLNQSFLFFYQEAVSARMNFASINTEGVSFMKSESKAVKSQATTPSGVREPVLTQEDLQILKAPFPRDRLGVKVQSFSKDRSRAMLVLYLQHTDVQGRLEEVDPAWTTEVLKEERVGDTVYVRLRLVLKGVSRENVGEGSDPKGAYSDALKRCAMLFGVGRYLYDSETVWVDYDESRDRFRNWSFQDYDRIAKGEVAESRPGLKTTSAPQPQAQEKKPPRSRDQLNRILMNLHRPFLTRYPDTKFVDLLKSRYGAGETRLLTVEQMEDLVQFMENQLKSVA
jgi:hypothetical protein